jgi:putative acetyltransferase
MPIREATNSDAEEIRELVFSVLLSYGLTPDPASTDSDLADLHANYFEKGGWFSVLEEGHVIIGTCGLYPIDAQTCELRKMYLSPLYRGKGLGRMLLEHALRTAEELGYHTVTLETASVLKEAIALYKKYGFTQVKADHLSCRCDQAYRKDL